MLLIEIEIIEEELRIEEKLSAEKDNMILIEI